MFRSVAARQLVKILSGRAGRPKRPRATKSAHFLSNFDEIRDHSTDSQERPVSTWSPLAATFNAKPVVHSGLNLGRPTGLFGIDQLQHPTGFYLLRDKVVAATDHLVTECCSPNRDRRMVSIFDELSDTLCQLADMAEFVRIAHPDPSYAAAAQDACSEINALVERLNIDRQLYDALKRVAQHGDIVPTDAVDQHVAKLFLFDFEQSGIHLDEAERLQVVELNEFILHTGSNFMRSTSAARAVNHDFVPAGARNCFERRGDNIIVSSLCAENPIEAVRELAYKVYMHPVEQQEQRLRDMLVARAQLAQLCGFPTFAHRCLRGSLAGSPDAAIDFLDALGKRLWPLALADFAEMNAVKRSHNPNAKDVNLWDVSYLSSFIKSKKIKMDACDVMPYLSLGACMDGLNILFDRLYSVTLQPENAAASELWSPDVHKLAVVHEKEGVLGYIYCDFLERQGKPNQDCHFTIRGGRELSNGAYQLPVVVLLLNFPSASWSAPSLLTPSMLENLFHEMGHAMHSMLARTKYQHVTGTRCSTDFAEVPSILMEYFACDPRVVSTFARHHRTGAAIPADLLAQLSQSKSVLCASEMQLQIFYAMLDQYYHGDLSRLGLVEGSEVTTTEVLAEVQRKYYGLPHVSNTAWQMRFGHLVGYGGKYYSYLMSKAVASWIWQKHFQADPFSRTSGENYRQEILAHGGGRPPLELLEGYLKEKVTPEKLVDFLITEIQRKNTEIASSS